MTKLLLSFVVISALTFSVNSEKSAISVAQDMYTDCLERLSFSCVKPKALSWLSNVYDSDVIKITDNLLIVKTENNQERSMHDTKFAIVHAVENFLETHSLKILVPEELKQEANQVYFARSLIGNAEDIDVPLAEKSSVGEGMGKNLRDAHHIFLFK